MKLGIILQSNKPEHVWNTFRLAITAELVMQKSKWQDFAKQVYEQNLVPKTQRFAILTTGPVFPRQLTNFNQN